MSNPEPIGALVSHALESIVAEDVAAKLQRFKRLWAQYTAILAEPTFEMSRADREDNDQRLGEVFQQLSELSKEG